MAKHFIKRNNCRLCGKEELEDVLRLVAMPCGDAYVSEDQLNRRQELYPLELVLCQSCGLAQLSGTVAPEVLYGNYIYNTSKSLGLVEHFQEYADEVLDYLNTPRSSFVIDIGSNDGTMLKCFQKRDMVVLGVDPARQVAQKAQDAGIRTLSEYFNLELARRIRDEFGPAKVITANNVFANIDDLIDMIGGIRELLDSDGIFVFETGYVVDLIQNKILDNIYHEHLSYYAVKPLESFFRNHGMQLIDIKRVPTKGGSLRGYVQLRGANRAVSKSVYEFISNEESLGFDQSEVFRNFAVKISDIKKDLLYLLEKFNSKGKSVCCYGASVGVTTLIYYFELGKFLSFIVDDDAKRHGLFSPGYHIPVLSSQFIYRRSPDYVLILSWRYAETIMKKHDDFLKQGGHFIIPLPEIKVV